MTIYALVLVLAAAGEMPAVTWHESEAACRERAAVEVWRMGEAGKPVSRVFCQRVRAMGAR